MGSVWKRLQRGGGKRAAKVRFVATLEELLVEGGRRWQPDKLTVVWTRRNRRVCSKPHSWQPGIENPYRGLVVWVLPESLEVVVTLYRDPDAATYDDKEWTFLVENESRGRRWVVAGAPLDLGRLAGPAGESGGGAGTPLSLSLRPRSRKVTAASLRLRLRATLLREGPPTEEDAWSLASLPPLPGEGADMGGFGSDPEEEEEEEEPRGPPLGRGPPTEEGDGGGPPEIGGRGDTPDPGGHLDPPLEITAIDTMKGGPLPDPQLEGGLPPDPRLDSGEGEPPPTPPDPPIGSVEGGPPWPPPAPQLDDIEGEPPPDPQLESVEGGPPPDLDSKERGPPRTPPAPQLGTIQVGSPTTPQLDGIDGGAPPDPQLESVEGGPPLAPQLHSEEGGPPQPPPAPELNAADGGPPSTPQLDSVDGGPHRAPPDPQIDAVQGGPPLTPHLDSAEGGPPPTPPDPVIVSIQRGLPQLDDGKGGPPRTPPDPQLGAVDGGPPLAPQLDSEERGPPQLPPAPEPSAVHGGPPSTPQLVPSTGEPPQTPPAARRGAAAAQDNEGVLVPPPRLRRPGRGFGGRPNSQGEGAAPAVPPRAKTLAHLRDADLLRRRRSGRRGDPPLAGDAGGPPAAPPAPLPPDPPAEPGPPEEGTLAVAAQLSALEREQARVEARALGLEQELRRVMATGADPPREEQLLQAWLSLVNQRNSLLRRHHELQLLAEEQDLERRFELLSQELREMLDTEDWLKSSAQRQREQRLLEELVALVDRRDRLERDREWGERAAQEEDARLERGLEQQRRRFSRRDTCRIA